MKRVFVNGTFDLLHPGHIALFNFAKSMGDHLLVAIDSDERVKSLKGADRPINDQFTRSLILQNLKPIDEVKIFNSESDLINKIREYEPDVMIVGSDYKDKRVIGSEHSKDLIFFNRDPRYSSTDIIWKVRNEHILCITDM